MSPHDLLSTLEFLSITIFSSINKHRIDQLTGTSNKKKVFKAMFTLYQLVKLSVAKSVPDRASVHTRNAAFEAVSDQEQYCFAPLLKVERSLSDRF